MSKVFIIDGNSLLFRAYFASAYSSETLMRTKDGIPTNAIFVFGNMMLKLMENIHLGDGVLVAFDTGEPTFRHQQLESYKAHRKPVPPELIQQFPLARQLLKSLGLFTFEKTGFEADDVAGTLATIAFAQGHDVHLYTSDRDFLQMVNGGVQVHLIKKGVTDIVAMTPELVFQEYGITPKQVVDYKGLVGDASDNIPGIPGIGEKTAIKLLTQYGTFENIIAHVDDIGGKLAENIKANLEIGKLSKQLAIIHTTIDLPFKVEDTFYRGYHFDEVANFSKLYELRTLLNKLPPHLKSSAMEAKNFAFETLPLWSFTEVSSLGISIDISGSNYHREPLLGLGIAFDNKAYYLSLDAIKRSPKLLDQLVDAKVPKYGFDIKGITVSLLNHGIAINGWAFDLMLASYTLDTSNVSSKEAILSFFGVEIPQEKETDLLNPGQPELAAKTALYSMLLYPKVLAELNAKQAEDLLFKVEQPLALVLATMEREGFPIDQTTLHTLGEEYKAKLNAIETDIYRLAGKTFNIASPKQVSEILFQELKLPTNKKGSTSVDALKGLVDDHPVVAKILEFRKYAKIISTYIDALPAHIFPDGKLHAIFNQALTTTGRLSSNDPNLQNISIKDEEGRMIRKAFFYPNHSHYLVSFDYSQIELRILAALSQCQPLIDIFNRDEDIHTATAKRLFNPGGPVTSSMRRKAKAVNFGIIYGISDWGLAEQLQIPPQDARLIIASFYDAYPEVRRYMNALVQEVQDQKYVKTILGRRRYLREISDSNFQNREFAKRAAMNAPIQGTAADLIKLAMIRIQELFESKKLSTKLILQVHDELIFKVPKDEMDRVIPLIRDAMEHALPLPVKIKVEENHAFNWYDLK